MYSETEVDKSAKKDPKLITQHFWKKIREEIHIDILLETKPKKPLKLYEIDPEDLFIDLEEVCLWSE